MSENSDRVPVIYPEAPDTGNGDYRKHGTKSVEFWVQLSPEQCKARMDKAAKIGKDDTKAMAHAKQALATAKREVKRIDDQVTERAALIETLEQEATEERAHASRPVEVFHSYVKGAKPREILVYDGLVVHSRLLREDEIDAQEEMALNTPAPEPTAEFLALVRAAVDDAREALGPDGEPDALLSYVRTEVPGLSAADDATIAAVVVELLTDEIIVRTLGAVAAGGRQITAVELLDAMGGGIEFDREFARTRLEALIGDGTVAVLDAGDAVCIELADPHETPESEPVGATDEVLPGSPGRLPLDDLVLDVLRNPDEKWSTDENGPYASAGQIRKGLPSDNLATLTEIGASLKRLFEARYVNRVKGTRSYQSAIVE